MTRSVLQQELLVGVQRHFSAPRRDISATSWKPDRISLSLPGYRVDIADHENPDSAALELLGIDEDQVLIEIEPPLRDGPELHGQSEERQHDRGRQAFSPPAVILTVTASSTPSAPCSAVTWPMTSFTVPRPPTGAFSPPSAARRGTHRGDAGASETWRSAPG